MKPACLASERIHELKDEGCYEMRRAEVYEDGRDVRIEDENDPGDQSVPSVEEINTYSGGELRAWEVGAAEFEVLWSSASPSR